MERHQARVDALRGVLEDHDMEESMIEPTAQRLAIMQRHAIASALPGASREMLQDLVDAHEEASRREGFISKVVKSPFRFMGRHPIITALGLGAAGMFLAPVVASGAWSRMEGGGARTVMDRIARFFRPGQVFGTRPTAAPVAREIPRWRA